jgi:transposase
MEVMTHNNQMLIATERERWLRLHLEGGLTIKELSKRSGFSRDTLQRWKRNYLTKGLEGLKEKSRAHHSHPAAVPKTIVSLISRMRLAAGFPLGARKISIRLKKKHGLLINWRTVHKVLKRQGLVRKRKRLPIKEKWAKKPLFAGDLVQIDVAFVRKFKGRWLYQFAAVDGYSRWKYIEIFKEQSNLSSMTFLNNLIARAPFRIKGIQTDNGLIFTNRYVGYPKSSDPFNPRLHPFDLICKEQGVSHYLTDPGKPAQNGKIERSHRTDRKEFWNLTSFRSLPEAERKLTAYLKWHNEEREHLGIGGKTPSEMLEVCQI